MCKYIIHVYNMYMCVCLHVLYACICVYLYMYVICIYYEHVMCTVGGTDYGFFPTSEFLALTLILADETGVFYPIPIIDDDIIENVESISAQYVMYTLSGLTSMYNIVYMSLCICVRDVSCSMCMCIGDVCVCVCVCARVYVGVYMHVCA